MLDCELTGNAVIELLVLQRVIRWDPNRCTFQKVQA
jgi:hypothetical protein